MFYHPPWYQTDMLVFQNNHYENYFSYIHNSRSKQPNVQGFKHIPVKLNVFSNFNWRFLKLCSSTSLTRWKKWLPLVSLLISGLGDTVFHCHTVPQMCCPSKYITTHMTVSSEVCVFVKNLPIGFASSENDAVICFPHVYSEHGDCGRDSRRQQLLQGRKLQKAVWWILPRRGKSLEVCAAALYAEEPRQGPKLDCLLSWPIICHLRNSSGHFFDSFPVTMSLGRLLHIS